MTTRVIVYREGEKLFDQEGESCFVTVLRTDGQGDLAHGGIMSSKSLLLTTALTSFMCLLQTGPEVRSAIAKVLAGLLNPLPKPKPSAN